MVYMRGAQAGERNVIHRSPDSRAVQTCADPRMRRVRSVLRASAVGRRARWCAGRQRATTLFTMPGTRKVTRTRVRRACVSADACRQVRAQCVWQCCVWRGVEHRSSARAWQVKVVRVASFAPRPPLTRHRPPPRDFTTPTMRTQRVARVRVVCACGSVPAPLRVRAPSLPRVRAHYDTRVNISRVALLICLTMPLPRPPSDMRAVRRLLNMMPMPSDDFLTSRHPADIAEYIYYQKVVHDVTRRLSEVSNGIAPSRPD